MWLIGINNFVKYHKTRFASDPPKVTKESPKYSNLFDIPSERALAAHSERQIKNKTNTVTAKGSIVKIANLKLFRR